MASRRARRALAAGVAGAVVVVAVVVVVVLTSHRAGDVSNPSVEFDRGRTQPAAGEPRQTIPRGNPSDDRFEWPAYGYDKQRTHVLPLRVSLRPPFRYAWSVRGSTLIEFTPVLCKRSVYLLKNDGALYQISRWTGKVEWKHKLGDLAASSPACSHGVVYVVLLRGKTGSGGRVVALDTVTGHVKWARPLSSRAESSPLLDHGHLYFGTESGTVYALRASDGTMQWAYHASGAVKGALALDRGRLFFGDYSGHVYAIRASNGHKLWKVGASGARAFGIGGGHFYSSPAVSYGRVYIGSTNGAVYSFAARNGALAWRKQTGSYVYASPAVGAVHGGDPTVWVGSYDGTLYALDAHSGRVRWSRHLGGAISGAATVVGDLVFVSSYGAKTTWALGARTGRTYWKTRRGAFNAVISDGRRIYFNGYSSLFGLDPRGVHYAHRRPRGLLAAQHQRSSNRTYSRHLRYLGHLCARERGDRRALKAHRCYRYWAGAAARKRTAG